MKKIPAGYGNIRVMCFVSIILLLTAASGNLIFENQRLEEQLVKVTHEVEILDAGVPNPVYLSTRRCW